MILHTENINNKVKSGLYIVSTPIGNLSDITLRALEVLKKSDYVLCEDTRISKNLLERYEIKSKLIANHKFNEKKNLSKVIDILKSGSVVSLISDAGTPSISDPGATLVNECVVNEIDIFPIPGASAVSSAVSISGFNEKYFFYELYLYKAGKLLHFLNFRQNQKLPLSQILHYQEYLSFLTFQLRALYCFVPISLAYLFHLQGFVF